MGIHNSGMTSSYSYFGTDFGNALDGYLYNVGGNLRIGNATTSSSSPSQSFFLFSNSTATPNIWITGSQVAINKSTGNINGSLDISGSTVITGSMRGQVIPISPAANTASMDVSLGNFFTLSLINATNYHISASNMQPGQTINLKILQSALGTGTTTFHSAIKQPSGSAYVASPTASAVDIISFVSFDSTALYSTSIKKLI